MGIGKRGFIPLLLILLIFIATMMNSRPFCLAADPDEYPDAEMDESDVARPIRSIEELNNQRLGVILGTTHDLFANAALDFTQLVYFDGPGDILEALYRGEVDALIDDLPVNRQLVKEHSDLYLLPEVLVDDSYAFAVRLNDEEMQKRINDILERYIQSGELAAMQEKWVDGTPETQVMPEIPELDIGETLRFGVSPISPPFCYPGPDGSLIGYEMELMARIANELNMRLTVLPMDFHDLVPSLLGRKTDVIGSCLSVTPDRAKILRYSTSLYDGGISVVVLK